MASVHIFTRLSTPYPLAVGLGLVAGSWFSFGNFGNIAHGCTVLAVKGKERRVGGLDVAGSVKVWAWFYDKASMHFAPTALVGSAAFLAAGFLAPSFSIGLAVSRTYLWATSAVFATIVPYTIFIMLPTNKRLLKFRDQLVAPADSSSKTIKALTSAEEEEVQELLDAWWTKHVVRTSIGFVGWALAFVAFGAL